MNRDPRYSTMAQHTRQRRRSQPPTPHGPASPTPARGADTRPPWRSGVLLLIGAMLGAGSAYVPQLVGGVEHFAAASEAPPLEPAEAPPPGAGPRRALAQPVDGTHYVYSDAAFARLDAVRHQKKAAITRLLADVAEKAERIAYDETMRTFFFRTRELYDTGNHDEPRLPPRLRRAVSRYRRATVEYYALNYLEFYDILCVSPDGYVFNSVRREADYHTMIDADSELGRGLRRAAAGEPRQTVIDYHYYAPSRRPSAFFVVPVLREGEFEGCFVLQYAIKMLDALLVDRSELGHTGEVYLVNHDWLVLTDSRFSSEMTHLAYSINAIDQAAALGHGIMRDYRDRRVLYSCEPMRVLETEWLLVAQIDEAEVITDYYRQNVEPCLGAITRTLRTRATRRRSAPDFGHPPMTVDMDEFMRAGPERGLATHGVSTCTAIAITYPGRFSYLAHLSPYDRIYGPDRLLNTLKRLLTRVAHYDILQSELHNLRVTIVATHAKSLRTALAKLLRQGFTLDQVRFLFNPDAHHAAVHVPPAGREVIVTWTLRDADAPSVVEWASDLPALAELIREDCRLTPATGDAGG